MPDKNKKDSTTDFFLKYIKHEKEAKQESNIKKAKLELKKNKGINKLANIYNSINLILDKMLQSKQSVLLVSLILAVSLFITLSGGEVVSTTTSGTTLKDVPVSIEGLKDNYEVSGIPSSVNVMVVGPSVDIYRTQLIKNYEIYADLSSYKEGTHTISLKSRNFDKDLEISIVPESFNINLSPKISKNFTVKTKFINQDDLDDKYSVSVRSVSSNTVSISASSSTLSKIKYVYAEVDVADRETSFTQKCSVKAYDAQNNELDVDISPKTVNVECQVDSYSKEVAIKPNFKGSLKEGYEIKNYKMSPSIVTIYGKRSDIADINFISTDIDIKDLSGSVILTGQKLNTDKRISKMSVNSIDINLTISKKEKSNG